VAGAITDRSNSPKSHVASIAKTVSFLGMLEAYEVCVLKQDDVFSKACREDSRPFLCEIMRG
jgi:hypothetical protein